MPNGTLYSIETNDIRIKENKDISVSTDGAFRNQMRRTVFLNYCVDITLKR